MTKWPTMDVFGVPGQIFEKSKDILRLPSRQMHRMSQFVIEAFDQEAFLRQLQATEPVTRAQNMTRTLDRLVRIERNKDPEPIEPVEVPHVGDWEEGEFLVLAMWTAHAIKEAAEKDPDAALELAPHVTDALPYVPDTPQGEEIAELIVAEGMAAVQATDERKSFVYRRNLQQDETRSPE